MRISDWSSDVCSSDLVLVRHRLDDLFDGTPAERWLKLMRPFVPRAPRELAAQSRGARLRLALQELGPIFVKFGQILSTRRDLVPPDVADELSELQDRVAPRSEEHTSELQSLMRISYAVFCLKQKKTQTAS